MNPLEGSSKNKILDLVLYNSWHKSDLKFGNMDSIEADAGTSPTTNMVKVPLVLDMFKLFNNLPLQTFIRITYYRYCLNKLNFINSSLKIQFTIRAEETLSTSWMFNLQLISESGTICSIRIDKIKCKILWENTLWDLLFISCWWICRSYVTSSEAYQNHLHWQSSFAIFATPKHVQVQISQFLLLHCWAMLSEHLYDSIT